MRSIDLAHCGGVARVVIPDRPEVHVAVLAAGRLAAGTGTATELDNEQLRRVLAKLPAGVRGATLIRGTRLAVTIVREHRGAIRAMTRELLRWGYY